MSIESRIEFRKNLVRRKNIPFGMGNPRRGNYLIIGEQSAKPPLHPIGQDPFCGLKGSSRWLNQLLEDNNISEEKLFWINALNLDGTEANIMAIVNKIRPSKIIALGNIASKLCEKHNLEHVKIPHPAYWKRFKSKEIYPLLKYVV